jgi:hypothetical protein
MFMDSMKSIITQMSETISDAVRNLLNEYDVDQNWAGMSICLKCHLNTPSHASIRVVLNYLFF